MEATTVKTLADAYAVMHPSNIAEVYLDAVDNPKISKAVLMAAVLTGWQAATQYIHDEASGLFDSKPNPDENPD